MGYIIALLDKSGSVVVKYVYDAWGNHEVRTPDGTVNDSVPQIGKLNPFRYRGYYYDTETKLYYLKTRYYDPEVGRFITIDDLFYIDPEHINGLNLYAYCGNNPVMAVDPDGTSWWKKFKKFWNSTVGKVIGTILVVAAVIVVSVATFGVGTAITGALGGGLIGSVISGAITGAISGAAFGAGISMITQGVTSGYGNINWAQVGKEALIGTISGAIAGGVFGAIKYVASAGKIAGHLSGLNNAQKSFDAAAKVLKDTPMAFKGGVMATERIAAQLSFDSASAVLGHVQSVSKVLSIVISGIYEIAKFGFKQLIGYALNNYARIMINNMM